MASTLRVDPDQLRATAAAQGGVSGWVSSMGAGLALAPVVQAMPGLESGAACQAVGAVLDEAANRISTELSAHADRLVSAAERYRAADAELARRLRRIAD